SGAESRLGPARHRAAPLITGSQSETEFEEEPMRFVESSAIGARNPDPVVLIELAEPGVEPGPGEITEARTGFPRCQQQGASGSQVGLPGLPFQEANG